MSDYPANDAADHRHWFKGTEVFVGGLAQSVTEAKIREVFSPCGEIEDIRMIKDQKGNLKGYCFLKFRTREAAVNAVKEKSGIMLEGRKVGVLPSAEHSSLFLGNLSKGWNSDDFDHLVRQAFQDVVSVNLVISLSDGGLSTNEKQRNRGFGFVQFSSHAARGSGW